MLFDLGGKRKRFIQVIYVMLALLLGGGLVLFGIGGDANGGLLDAVGLGSNSDGAEENPTYEKQIDDANAALATNPADEAALLKLARYQFLSGQASVETDETTGQQTLTEDALNRFTASVEAWNTYLETKPKSPDDDVASLMVQAYQSVIDLSDPLAEEQLDELVATAQVVADARPSLGTYQDLLSFAYIAGQDRVGAEAAESARAEASDETQRKGVDQLVKGAKAQGKAIQKQLAGGGKDTSQLEDPTGSLGGSGSLVPPAGATP